MKNKFLTISASLFLVGCSQQEGNQLQNKTTENKEKLPNIVFIYADDLGYGDLSCNGSDSISTPHLDQMAQNGVNFTNFYSCSPVSSPSRAGLLTGRYQVRAGITRVFFPNSLQGIEQQEVTMPELLKEKGYETALVGKWHLGHLPEFHPQKHGFDYFFGLLYSNDMEWAPRHDPPLALMRNNTILDSSVYQPTLTQRYTAEAKYFIAKNQDKPFFLYFAHTFPHKPWYVSAQFKNTANYKNPQHQLYGDCVQELDHSVGEIFKTLKELGLEENTIVVFSSDNGSTADLGKPSTGGLRGYKATTFEGGIRVPTLAYWKGNFPAGKKINDPAIMIDWLPTFASIVGVSLPTDCEIDGKNLIPLITGKGKRQGNDEFYFYDNEELQAIRVGKWKYKKAFPGNRKLDAHGELLFDLETDPYEQNNLIAQKTEKVKELKQKMQDFITNLGDVPEPKLKAKPFDDPRKKK